MIKRLRNSVALVMALVLTVTIATSCDTRRAMEIEGVDIPAGVYLYYMLNAYSSAQNQVSSSGKDLFKEKIGDLAVADWIKAETMSACRVYALIEKRFEEKGLKLSDEDQTSAEQYVESMYSSYEQAMTDNGISKASLSKAILSDYKRTVLFESLYGEGGEKQVPIEELRAYFGENYYKVQMILMNKKDSSSGEDIATAQLQEYNTLAQDYLERLRAGEAFNDLYDEFQEHENPADEEGDNGTDGNKDTDKDTDKENQEPTEEEQWTNENKYVQLLEKDNTSIPKILITKLGEMRNGDIARFDDETYLYVVKKLDAVGDPETIVKQKETILNKMKSQEFTNDLKDQAGKLKVDQNSAAIRRYQPKNIKPLSEYQQ